MCGCETEKQRETERKRDRQRETETERKKERERERERMWRIFACPHLCQLAPRRVGERRKSILDCGSHSLDTREIVVAAGAQLTEVVPHECSGRIGMRADQSHLCAGADGKDVVVVLEQDHRFEG